MKSGEDLRGQLTLHVGEPMHTEVIRRRQIQKSRISVDVKSRRSRVPWRSVARRER